MSSLPSRGLVELADAIASGESTALAVTEETIERISRQDAELGTFLHVDAEGALEAAAAVDRAREAGQPLGKLAGVPIAVKDNLCTKGLPTTCASKILEGYRPPYDANVVERLRAEGAVIVGKTNLDEFAMGSSNENSAYRPVKNPWNVERAPGGSSGGSAAAVAAGFAAGSLGSDTGGSVRQPGSFCGVTAVKPTYGRVSRYGLIAFASSLDQVGPMARSVEDAARLLSVIAGHDGRDATSSEHEVDDYEGALDRSVEGLRVGVVREQVAGLKDADTREAIEGALKSLRERGASLIDVSLPHARHAVSVYYLIACSEASSNLARFDGMRYGLRVDGEDLSETYEKTRARGFGAEVKRRIMLGTYALSAGYYDAFYLKAQKVRTLIRRDFDAALAGCDVLVSPTTPTPAFPLGDKIDDPLAMYLADIYTLPASLAGLPALSTPVGVSSEGLPLGIQLTGAPFTEATLLRAAKAIEGSLVDWPKLAPAFS